MPQALWADPLAFPRVPGQFTPSHHHVGPEAPFLGLNSPL